MSHQTAFEWRHRVLATVPGYQGRIVLRDRVWIDETYVNDTDLSKGHGQARKRGLSRQKLCILVAIDVFRSIETALVTKPFFTRHHEKFSLIITVCQ